MDWIEATHLLIGAAAGASPLILQDWLRFGRRARYKRATRIEDQCAEFMATLDMALLANTQFYDRVWLNHDRHWSLKEPDEVMRGREAVVQKYRAIVWRLRVRAHDAQLKAMLEKIAPAFDHDLEEIDAGFAFSVADGYTAQAAGIRQDAAAIVDRMQALYRNELRGR